MRPLPLKRIVGWVGLSLLLHSVIIVSVGYLLAHRTKPENVPMLDLVDPATLKTHYDLPPLKCPRETPLGSFLPRLDLLAHDLACVVPLPQITPVESLVPPASQNVNPPPILSEPTITISISPESPREVIPESDKVTPPMPQRGIVRPRYPVASRRRGEEGLVTLDASIDAAGLLLKASISISSGFPALDAAALEAVQKMTFRPATRNGKNIPGSIKIPIQFKLTN